MTLPPSNRSSTPALVLVCMLAVSGRAAATDTPVTTAPRTGARAPLQSVVPTPLRSAAPAPPRSEAPTATESALAASAESGSALAATTEPDSQTLEWSLVGIGGLALVSGFVMGAFAPDDSRASDASCSSTRADGESTPCIGAAASTLRRPSRLGDVADLLGLLGLVSLGAGATLLVVADEDDPTDLMDSASLDAACSAHGCAIGLSGKF